jgi:hypothetical protein
MATITSESPLTRCLTPTPSPFHTRYSSWTYRDLLLRLHLTHTPIYGSDIFSKTPYQTHLLHILSRPMIALLQ